MEPNTLTTIGRLSIGDRFYKAGDKKKEVWQKVTSPPKKTSYQTYSHFADRDTDHNPVAFKGDTRVVFLRQTKPGA